MNETLFPALKCPECGDYKGHGPKCELQTPAEWREQAIFYYDTWLKLETRRRQHYEVVNAAADEKVRKAKTQIAFWQGKFRIVKTENNALRKKLK